MDQANEELSAREVEILQLVSTGVTNQQVAVRLGISVNTVKAHLRRIFGKLGVESRTEATTLAIQLGLIQVAGLPPEAVADARGDGQGSAALGRAAPRPTFRLAPGQWVVLGVGLLVIVALTVWPSPGAARQASGGRFVDLPGASAVTATEEGALRWTERTPMSIGRARFALAYAGDLLYAISGMTEEGWTASVTAYDPAGDRWAARADKPTPAANIGAAVVGGHIYVPGGYGADGQALRVLEVYDPVADAWERGADLPVGLFAYAISADAEGFYLLGGYDGTAYSSVVYRYSIPDDAWTSVSEMPAARAFAAAGTVGGRIYVVGGYDGQTESSACWSFDPVLAAEGQDAWRVHAPMSAGRAGHSLVAAEDRLFVVGGGWDGMLLHNEVYDVTHDVWSTFESPIVGEWRTLGLSGVTGQDGTRLYAVGGWSGQALAGVQVYQATFRVYAPLQ